MHNIPSHIPDGKWTTLTDEEKAIEVAACELLESREIILNDTSLILACLDHNVMNNREILNYPQPQDWSAEECENWCLNEGIDFRSQVKAEVDRSVLYLWVADIILFGWEDINTDVLQRIVIRLLDSKTEYGLSRWRTIVEINIPQIYEWWAIEEELADDLIKMGYFVLKNQHGQWWGRTCCGMSMLYEGMPQSVVRRRQQAVSKHP